MIINLCAKTNDQIGQEKHQKSIQYRNYHKGSQLNYLKIPYAQNQITYLQESSLTWIVNYLQEPCNIQKDGYYFIIPSVITIATSHKMAAGRSFLKNGVRRTSKWSFPMILLFITIENNIVYNQTMNQNVITRYVKVIRTLRLFFLRFCAFQYIFS